MMDLDAVVVASRDAQRTWAREAPRQRKDILRGFRATLAREAARWVEDVERARPRLPGETLAAELLPLAEAARFLERCAARLLAPRIAPARAFPLWLAGVRVEIHREPLGVVLVIAPSNYPLMLAGIQALQALAVGNAVLIKPGVGARPALERFRDALVQSGLDPRLCAVLDESPDSAQAAIRAGVDKVVLTGSAPTGAAVLSSLAEHLTPAVMELSGCDAVFVLEDADAALTARALAFGVRLNGGATCIAPRRVFVHARRHDALRRALQAALEGVAPLPVTPAAADRAARLIRSALDAGATLLAGEVPSGPRMTPVALDQVRPEMAVAQEDLQAPVLLLIPCAATDEALRMAERCPYALGAGVFGGAKAARETALRVRAGVVTINDLIAPTAHPRAPFGGRGRSGFGVTRGAEGLLEMTAIKVLCLRRGARRPHYTPPSPALANFLQAYLQLSHSVTWAERCRAAPAFFRALFALRRAQADASTPSPF